MDGSAFAALSDGVESKRSVSFQRDAAYQTLEYNGLAFNAFIEESTDYYIVNVDAAYWCIFSAAEAPLAQLKAYHAERNDFYVEPIELLHFYY